MCYALGTNALTSKNLAKKERSLHPEPGRWWSKQIQLIQDEDSKIYDARARIVVNEAERSQVLSEKVLVSELPDYAHCPGVSCRSLSSKPQDFNGIQPIQRFHTRIHQVFGSLWKQDLCHGLNSSTGVYLFQDYPVSGLNHEAMNSNGESARNICTARLRRGWPYSFGSIAPNQPQLRT